MADTDLKVIVKSKELLKHTYTLTTNVNRYPKKYRHSLVDRMQLKLIKGELGIEYYGRYTDDFYLIHESKEYLKYCLFVIGKFLETLDLTLNGKTQIAPFKNGISYLGFHTYISTDGKVIRKLKNQNKRNNQKKYLKMAKLAVEGKLPIEKLITSYSSWKNHISQGNCYKLGKAMDKKIIDVFEGTEFKEVFVKEISK